VSWSVLIAAVLLLGLAVVYLRLRTAERGRNTEVIAERKRAKSSGTHTARLQYPNVDLARCIGCGTCVESCPETGVLQMVNGQAMVVHGARCVGHGLCARDCPVGAIAVELGDIAQRDDIPALSECFESTLTPGVFLAGEITGYALIRTAINHGTLVANEVAERARRAGPPPADCFDLVIVGAGPAGLACALQSKLRGTSFVLLEQAELGGTVAKYPRRKLVMTQPVTLPLHGRLKRTSYAKEELMELWAEVIEEQQLPVRTGIELHGVDPLEGGLLRVRTSAGQCLARNVCLALGRRGTPNRLGVPGEELAKVSYSLLDAEAYEGRRILVVGGGDSAIEAALGLAEQPDNQVALSYRKGEFSRIKPRNEQHLRAAVERGRIEVLFQSEVLAIEPGSVTLRVGEREERVLANDEVFVFAGGKPPFELLKQSGISFDPADRVAAKNVEPTGGLQLGLSIAFGVGLLVLGWVLFHAEYYSLPDHERPLATEHDWLRPSGPAGLVAGSLALLMICANLAYLARRSLQFSWLPGTLRRWMTMHVATGIGAFLLVIVHSAMSPQRTPGGDAFYGLAILVVSGAIGRWFYSFVPRAANGRELGLDEIERQMAELSGRWDRVDPAFTARVRSEIQRVQGEGRWKGTFVQRARALFANQRLLRDSLLHLRREAVREGLSAGQVAEVLALARDAQRTALMAAHYDDLRALLSSWRWLHRWTALTMVLLVLVHVWTALRFGSFRG
jgi:thioredoxin reductase/ferredoxin